MFLVLPGVLLRMSIESFNLRANTILFETETHHIHLLFNLKFPMIEMLFVCEEYQHRKTYYGR